MRLPPLPLPHAAVRALIGAAGISAALSVSAAAGPAMHSQLISYEALEGWAEDDHAAALLAFAKGCATARSGPLGLRDGDWAGACAAAARATDPRGFFELHFAPVLLTDDSAPLFTGYYEPELAASRTPDATFRHPLLRLPPDLDGTAPGPSRAQIEDGAYAGRGLELVWLADPVDLFFLQVQGSGRLRFADGSVMRVGFGGRNGHEYASIGAILRTEGVLSGSDLTAEGIKAHLRAHPEAGRAVMRRNPSYIFFREIEGLMPEDGPIGAQGIPLSPMRSVAVDTDLQPLGAPVWVETHGPEGPIRRLMIAQDAGAAIKGAQRMDLFFGAGPVQGRLAGEMGGRGRALTLIPRAAAARLAEGS